MIEHNGTPADSDGAPVFVNGEIGLNRTGRVARAIQRIDVAADAGASRSGFGVARRLRQ